VRINGSWRRRSEDPTASAEVYVIRPEPAVRGRPVAGRHDPGDSGRDIYARTAVRPEAARGHRRPGHRRSDLAEIESPEIVQQLSRPGGSRAVEKNVDLQKANLDLAGSRWDRYQAAARKAPSQAGARSERLGARTAQAAVPRRRPCPVQPRNVQRLGKLTSFRSRGPVQRHGDPAKRGRRRTDHRRRPSTTPPWRRRASRRLRRSVRGGPDRRAAWFVNSPRPTCRT